MAASWDPVQFGESSARLLGFPSVPKHSCFSMLPAQEPARSSQGGMAWVQTQGGPGSCAPSGWEVHFHGSHSHHFDKTPSSTFSRIEQGQCLRTLHKKQREYFKVQGSKKIILLSLYFILFRMSILNF